MENTSNNNTMRNIYISQNISNTETSHLEKTNNNTESGYSQNFIHNLGMNDIMGGSDIPSSSFQNNVHYDCQQNIQNDYQDSSNMNDYDSVRTLFVSGLPHDVRKREIQTLFSYYQGLSSVVLRHVGAYSARPVAFVSFNTRDNALKALQALNGYMFDLKDHSVLKVEFAKSNTKSMKPQMKPAMTINDYNILNYYSKCHLVNLDGLFKCFSCGALAPIVYQTGTPASQYYYNCYPADNNEMQEFQHVPQDFENIYSMEEIPIGVYDDFQNSGVSSVYSNSVPAELAQNSCGDSEKILPQEEELRDFDVR